jgi:MFS family permease
VASLGGGLIADRFSKSYWTKALLCIQGCAVSIPLLALCCSQTDSFYTSIWCYALVVLFSGAYSGPAITMIQNTSPQNQQGNAVSVYFFFITLSQTIAPFIFNSVANIFGVLQDPALYGSLIIDFVFISYLLSLPFWCIAGARYSQYMTEKDDEKIFVEAVREIEEAKAEGRA